MFGFSNDGSPTPGGPGQMAWASGAVALRYVNGQRRLLVPMFTEQNPKTGQFWGDLVEWREPEGEPYTGPDPRQAPPLIETGRWADWTAISTLPTWQDGNNGMRIGGLYWDEAQGVLWYSLYGYYSGKNMPFLAATRLLDAEAGPGYRLVGAKYGPWWYRNNNPRDTNLYWKAVDYWLAPIPASSRPDLRNRNMIVGAAVGAVGGAGHLGPGFHAITLPPLTDAPNATIPLGLRLADYSADSPQGRRECVRDPTYAFDGNPHGASDTGLMPASKGVGRWQMSLDQVNSLIWVETETREGILLFGRQARGTTWYGFNPRSIDPGYRRGPEALDPSRPNPERSNGYGATEWAAALYIFDPAQVREVGRGKRSPYSDGMKPVVTYDWHQQWPNVPKGGQRFIDSSISSTGLWDPSAREVIWIQPMSVAARPTINFFRVGS